LIESIAPHVDVICPMLYPSHFSPGFLGQLNLGDSPHEIVELSLKRMQKRTDKIIRPWIQGFWYNPAEINAQLNGLANAKTASWSVWNPSGNYSPTYAALAARLNQTFAEPQFYPSLAEIGQRDQHIIPGRARIVNLTNFKQGYSIISLEASGNKNRSAYTTLIQVLETLDEGIMDKILATRQIPFTLRTGKYSKKLQLAELLCRDLQIDPHVLRPKPIYINWQNACRFSRTIPHQPLIDYETAGEALLAGDRDIYAIKPGSTSAQN